MTTTGYIVIAAIVALYAFGMLGRAAIRYYDRTHPDDGPPMTGE
jgi:hypothetical protein